MAVSEAVIRESMNEDPPASNGWFQLAVPAEGSTVSVKKIVRHIGDGKPVDISDILKKLKGHKVVHGVNADAIYELLQKVEDNDIPEDAVVIASSDVIQGEDGALEWHIEGLEDKGSETMVCADMHIATLKKAIKGKPGKNVFGKIKQPRPIYDPQIQPGNGISVEEESEGVFVYKSEYAGELKIEEDRLFIDFHLSLSEDQMQATMDIPAGRLNGAANLIAEQDILAILQLSGITHGILNDNILDAITKQGETPGFVKNILVAKGKEARDGVDARLQIDDELAVGKLLESGQIDFHEKSYPWNIKTSEVIGQVIPSVEEENGFNVVGKVIPAKPALGANLVLEGIKEESDGKLISLGNGVLLVNGRELKVTDSLLIKGDVCHRTGNIHSDQTVIVKGYVEPGFILDSKGDVVIEDNVEQSEVRANGSIVIKSGVRGSQSKVISRGNITAGFIENARMRALGDIVVENSLVSCDSFCRGELRVGKSSSKKSTLIGGVTRAIGGIVAANLGSEGFKKTDISVGCHPDLLQKSRKLSEELTKIERQLNKLEHLLLQHSQSSATSEQRTLSKLKLDQRKLRKEFERLTKEQEKLQKIIAISRKSTVQISQHVFPGVNIQILDKVYEVRKKENAGLFFLEDELIIFRPAA
ncbi:MAG: DUF342 domain-containing protein [Gammaproteobacteria bacterium]|nr:DUF342 domain-containing protein [Gammaproteobacteria bacterium]